MGGIDSPAISAYNSGNKDADEDEYAPYDGLREQAKW